MRIRFDLNDELLAECVREIHGAYDTIEDEDFDHIEELSDTFATLVDKANAVLEWVAQAKASLAQVGVAA